MREPAEIKTLIVEERLQHCFALPLANLPESLRRVLNDAVRQVEGKVNVVRAIQEEEIIRRKREEEAAHMALQVRSGRASRCVPRSAF
eukprot:5230614-Pleurochrysis_carterae.AAC.1